MKKGFIDTNLAIAFTFNFNSLHLKSDEVFKIYYQLFWSNFVKKEFYRRYYQKQENLLEFFLDLQVLLENPNKEFYSPFDLLNFTKNQYSGKKMNDAKSSINPFWSEYFGIENQVSFLNMKNSINHCLNDLSLNSYINKQYLESIMKLTPQRIRSYDDIDNMLKSEGVKDADRIVTLDGHDFACRSDDPIDFVTFDEDCFNGASNIEILCFSSIKGKYDFEPS